MAAGNKCTLSVNQSYDAGKILFYLEQKNKNEKCV